MPKVMKIQGAERAGQSVETGHVHARTEEKTEACVAFTSLPTEFPKAEAALLSRAKSEASKLNCK